MNRLDAGLVSVQQSHRRALERLYAAGRAEWVLSIARLPHGEYLSPDADSLQAWMQATFQQVEQHLPLSGDPVTFRPLVVEFWPLGVHYVDALFGAVVNARDGNFWSEYLPTGLADLRPVEVSASPLVKWTLAAMEQVLSALPAGLSLTTPVLSSPLNIAVNLFGQRALEDLVRPEGETLAGLRVIADAIGALHRLMRSRFGGGRVRFYASSHRYAPDGVGHICGCTTQLVGPETYARHVAPLDERVLGAYEGGGTIHLCGRHTQHIPCWRRMRPLRGVQLNDAAADDFAAYFHGLRDDQVIYASPTGNMTVDRILDISGGRRVVIQAKLDRRVPTGH